MGNLLPIFQNQNDATHIANTKPADVKWITIHASVTGMNLVLVERLWTRFCQLGADKNTGILTDQAFAKAPLSSDIFMRNIIANLSNLPNKASITFITFLRLIEWLNTNTLEEKVKATFIMLARGKPVAAEALPNIIQKILPNLTQSEQTEFTTALIKTIGTFNPNTNTTEIQQDDYVRFVMNSFSRAQLDEWLKFSAMPDLADAARTINVLTKQERSDFREHFYQIVTEPQMDRLAPLLVNKDYQQLAHRLGFFESDVRRQENLYRGDKVAAIRALLRDWQIREGTSAYIMKIIKVLQDCHMNDLVKVLY